MEAARGWSCLYQLSTSSSDDDAPASEAFGVARVWHGSEKRPHDVLGQHGHQDGLRRGKTKAYRKK